MWFRRKKKPEKSSARAKRPKPKTIQLKENSLDFGKYEDKEEKILEEQIIEEPKKLNEKDKVTSNTESNNKETFSGEPDSEEVGQKEYLEEEPQSIEKTDSLLESKTQHI